MKPSIPFLRALRARSQFRPEQCLAPRLIKPSLRYNNAALLQTSLSRRPYNTAYSHQYSPEPPPSRKRLRRTLQIFFIGLCLSAGYNLGEWAFEIPEPGTEEDEEEFALIHLEFETIPWVQDFLARGRQIEIGLRYRDDALEYAFAGTRGLAYSRTFQLLDMEGAVQHFFMFGRTMCGWPNTVHGGATATIAQNCLLLSAALTYPQAMDRPFDDTDVEVTALDITYKRPIKPDVFYHITTTADPLLPSDRELLIHPDPTKRPEIVTRGVIRDLHTQETCAEVLAKFRVKGDFQSRLVTTAQEEQSHPVD